MVLMLSSLLGCGSAPSEPTSPVELRTWELAPGLADRLVASLDRAMVRAGAEAEPIGRATVGPGGILVVVAPRRVLDGVDALVSRAASVPAPAPPRDVEITYWVVRVQADAPPDPRLAKLTPALDLIRASDGVAGFALQETRVLRTLEGEHGSLDGDRISVEQVASLEVGADRVVADVKIDVPRLATIRTRISAPAGETVVLAQTEVDEAGETVPVYVIVRPTVTGPR